MVECHESIDLLGVPTATQQHESDRRNLVLLMKGEVDLMETSRQRVHGNGGKRQARDAPATNDKKAKQTQVIRARNKTKVYIGAPSDVGSLV